MEDIPEEWRQCPICKNGVIIEILEDIGKNNRIIIYYSCNHEFSANVFQEVLKINDELKISSKSNEKIRNKSIIEYLQEITKKDRDRPDLYVSKIFLKKRSFFKNDTAVFSNNPLSL